MFIFSLCSPGFQYYINYCLVKQKTIAFYSQKINLYFRKYTTREGWNAMGFFFLKIWLKLTYYLRPTYLAKKCPHRTKKMGLIKVHGRERIMSLKENDSGGFDYCIACIAKKTIRCAWCGNPIFIGDPVTLYSPKKGVKMPDHAVRYKDTDCYVGCLGWDCAETGGDRAGFWHGQERFIGFRPSRR
jgi:phage FluMu protein Com